MMWRDQAECRGTNATAFLDPDVLDDPLTRIEALQYCNDCPVTQPCGEWASHEPFTGIAGGRVFKNGRPLAPSVLRKRDWERRRRERRNSAS